MAQKDSLTPKVLKLHFVSVKNDPASISNVVLLTFDIKAEPCLIETKCNFRTLGEDKSDLNLEKMIEMVESDQNMKLFLMFNFP